MRWYSALSDMHVAIIIPLTMGEIINVIAACRSYDLCMPLVTI